MKETKGFKYGIGVKTAAVILFLLFTLVTFVSWLGVYYLADQGYYNNSGSSFYDTELCDDVTRQYANTVFYEYYGLYQKSIITAEEDVNAWPASATPLSPDETFRLEQLTNEFSNENTNFLFILSDENNKELLKNYQDIKNESGMQRTYIFNDNSGHENVQYTLSCFVREPLIAEDEYTKPFEVYQMLFADRYNIVILAAVSSVIAIVLFIFLMCAAGHRKNSIDIVLTWQHRIPLDLFIAGLILIGALAVNGLEGLSFSWNGLYGFLVVIPVSVMLLVFFSLFLAFCLNLAVRVKKGSWWVNTIIYRILRLMLRALRSIFKALVYLFQKLPMIWKAALLIAGYLLMNMLITAAVVAMGAFAGVLAWLLFNFAVFAALCFLLLQLKKLKAAGAQIAAGDYGSKIDTTHMLWEIRQHADNLNNIGAGMSNAVEERMKSERLKTELITNVSHDIKTPLTSIVNYIDLLKKEPIENETVSGYIEVLDRQSLRLKKLTEDLLEASKASTGNMTVCFARTDLVELINQSVGEYAERFEENQLVTVFHTNKEQAAVSADGRLMWRVFDNLLNNICKYSQPNTRVYIHIEADDQQTRTTIMNISRYQLNIPSGELMERFVRGDISRTTDGSGLGLSIAKSLTELQNGSFKLSIDGDLFKAVIIMDSV